MRRLRYWLPLCVKFHKCGESCAGNSRQIRTHLQWRLARPQRSLTLDLPPKSGMRIEAIDLARVVAMVLMIEGHTLDALLHPSYQSAGWYNLWLFVRGFTAPTFMMMSGFSFALATLRHWGRYSHLSAAVLRRALRFASFILLGYAMRFPVRSLRDLRWLDAAGWQAGLQVDVLQAIGATLLLLQLLVLVSRTPARFARLCLGLAAAIALAAPALWLHWKAGELPTFLLAYIGGSTGSPFPLFPWAAYLLLGAAAGRFYFSYGTRGGTKPTFAFARVLLFGGALAAVTGMLLEKHAIPLYGEAIFWKASPTLVLLRVGVVSFLMGTLLQLRQLPQAAGSTIRIWAEESLLVYFVHVCLLYGSLWNTGLRQNFSGLNAPQALLAAAAMIASMLLLALLWNRFKRGLPLPALAFRVAMCMVAVWSLM